MGIAAICVQYKYQDMSWSMKVYNSFNFFLDGDIYEPLTITRKVQASKNILKYFKLSVKGKYGVLTLLTSRV